MVVFFFFNLISQFVLNSCGEERATSWAPFNLVFFVCLFICLLELRSCQIQCVSNVCIWLKDKHMVGA